MATRQTEEGQRLITQLFTLDVNTLVTKEPSGEKAPSMEVMVQNLAERYGAFAADHAPDQDPAHHPFLAASRGADRLRADRPGSRHGILDRVARNGAVLHDIVDRAGKRTDAGIELNPRKLQPEDAATIRKAWELSLDPVDLTTSVTLEGDVITRFTSRDGAVPEMAVIGFHEAMVQCGLGSWRSLMDVVSQFLATLGRFFFA